MNKDKEIVYHASLLDKKCFGNVREHPLFMKHIVAHPPKGYQFYKARHRPKWSCNDWVLSLNRAIFQNLEYTTNSDLFSFSVYKKVFQFLWQSGKKQVDFLTCIKFILSRNIGDSLFALSNEKRLIFFQTIPLTLSNQDWVIEIEDSTTLFYPFINNGQTADLDLQSHPAFRLVKHLLETPQCKKIITHIKSTADSFPFLFNSETITNKVSYLTPGIAIPEITLEKPQQEIKILFSNSWHGHEGGLILRGGLDAIEAFKQIAEKYPHVTLILRSTIPDSVKVDIQDLIDRSRIRIVDQHLSSNEWHELRKSCHIYLLPAVRIHVVSLLEALSYGMAVICSDGWGFEEFIENGVNGLVVRGRLGKESWIDPEKGVLREDYSFIHKPTPFIIDQLIEKISFLIENPEKFIEIRESARNCVLEKYSLESWNQKLKTTLDSIYDEMEPPLSLQNAQEKTQPEIPIHFPTFVDEHIIDIADNGELYVQSSEDYHTQNNNVLFTSWAYSECVSKIRKVPSKKQAALRNLVNGCLKIVKKVGKPVKNLIRQIHSISKKIKSNKNEKLFIYAGRLQPFVETCVGSHPVFEFIKFAPEGYKFITHEKYANPGFFTRIARKLRLLSTIMKLGIKAFFRGIPLSFITNFFSSRFINQQTHLPAGSKNLVLYPTYPFTCGQHSWFVEIEDMFTLMTPFAFNGASNLNITKDCLIIRMLEVLFESSNFKGVISHLRSTADGLNKIFEHNPTVQQKMLHIPLGVPLPNRVVRYRQREKKIIKILFLNGWAQSPQAFFRRGGLNALDSFSLLREKYDNVTLILRSKLPLLAQKYINILEKGQKNESIVHLNEKISQADLKRLYHDCDILLFPASRIAITTILQGMGHSLAVVASDGFGIEEYVEDKVNGLIARGYYDTTGYIDNDGIFREDYIAPLSSNQEVVENAARLMGLLVDNPDLMHEIQLKARETVENKFSIRSWNEHFSKCLKETI